MSSLHSCSGKYFKKVSYPISTGYYRGNSFAVNIPRHQNDLLSANLVKIGLELIDNRISGTIEKIKQLVIKKARNEVDEKKSI